MKNKLLFVLFTILLGYGLISNSGGRASVAMDGNTGAPGETGITCGTCHTGGNFGTINAILTVTGPNGLPATDYVPGSTYNIILQGIATGGFPSGYGFQMTALDPNNSSAGAWSNNGAGTAFGTALGRTYWEQTAPAPVAAFTASWTAPGAGKGDVTFYYIMTAVNGSQSTMGDQATMPLTFTLPEGAAGCPTVNVFATTVSNVLCAGSCNGIAAAQASGGAIPYTYQWSNGASAPIVSNLCAGSYTVTLTDANGCTGVGNVSITEPTAALMISSAVGNVTCNGACDGSITAIAAGGTPPYTYAYNPPNPSCAGTYTVIVSDANGCIASVTATITEPTAIVGTMTTTPVSAPGGSDGSGTVTANGGIPPYTYQWDNGETSATATALSAAVHCVTITDSNACTLAVCETVGGGTSSNNQIAALKSIQLYPNPAQDQTTLELSFSESVDAAVRVVNALGQTVIGFEMKQEIQQLSEQIDLSGLGAGVYMVEVRVDQAVITRRLLRN